MYDCLEKVREYELACRVIIMLLQKCLKLDKRGKWWHRFCVDLNKKKFNCYYPLHSYAVAYKAVVDESVRGEWLSKLII